MGVLKMGLDMSCLDNIAYLIITFVVPNKFDIHYSRIIVAQITNSGMRILHLE
jgi:hypothetical protein